VQEPLEIEVNETEWDESNEVHCARHEVSPWLVEELLNIKPLFFPNKAERSGTHKMVGPSRSGRHWTIIMVNVGEGRWRPITGWPSDKPEIELYKANQEKGGADEDQGR
jgi:uncharacterized DUF497 family protein